MNLRKFHAVAIALIASAAFVSQARADYLHVGSNPGPEIVLTGTSNSGHSIDGQGGDFQPSTMGPDSSHQTALPWVFCVDVNHGVNPGGNFASTSVSTTGFVNGSLVNNANEIAYVLLNYASTLANQGAVQAAIWYLEYYKNPSTQITYIDNGSGHNSISQINLANSYVAAAQAYTGPSLISQLAWLTLTPDNQTQGLVTDAPSVAAPEPSSLAIAGLAGLGMLLYARSRRSR